MRGLIEGVAMFFPCKTCSKDFSESIRQSPPKCVKPPSHCFGFASPTYHTPYPTPPNSVESRSTLSLWLCDQHNRVNEKLGKPRFRCEMVRPKERKKGADRSLRLMSDQSRTLAPQSQSCLEKRWKRSNEEACLNDQAEAPGYTVGDCQTEH